MIETKVPALDLMRYPAPSPLRPNVLDQTSNLVAGCSRTSCSCSCHGSRQISSPTYLAGLTGRLAVKHSGGVLGSVLACSSPDCERHQPSTLSIQYAFPPWLLGRLVQIVASNTGYPKLALRAPCILSQDHPIFEFARSGDIGRLQDAFSAGLATPTVVTEHGESLLQYSVAHGHPDACRFLIRAGADPLVENKVFTTPGIEAWDYILRSAFPDKVCEEYRVIFKDKGSLEDRGFAVVHEYVLGLRQATSFRDAMAAHASLIDVQDQKGRTPLHWATLRSDVDKVKDLLHLGANLGIHDNGWGNTPLDYAARLKTGDCTKALLEGGADPNTRTTCKWTPLYGCGAYRKSPHEAGHVESARHLIAWNADVTLRDEDGLDALMKATRQDLPMLTECLLDEGGMNINTCDASGTSAVSLAVIRASHRVLRILLHRGADVTTKNSHRQSLLHVMAKFADPETVNILSQSSLVDKLDPDARDNNGQSPMDYARARSDLPPGGLSRILDLLADIRMRRHTRLVTEVAHRDTTLLQLEAGVAHSEDEKGQGFG